MINLILCGGSGTRLWPISRTAMPKQFVKLFNNKSLFQLTTERNNILCDKQCIVTSYEQYFLAFDQLEEIKKRNNVYLLEPIPRNTAPAIALACMSFDKEELVLVTPSDHLIKDEEEYKKVILKAQELAKEGNIVTFGITPTFPETGFGYIESENIFNVKAFHEKPTFEIAKSYIEAGNYYWNSGMFMFKAGVFLNELKKHSPEIFETSKKAFEYSTNENNLIRIKYENMVNIPEESIDYAVMEKSNIMKVIPSNIKWSDLGSFDSFYTELEKDENGNTVNNNHILIDSYNNLVYGDNRKIATIDIEDLIVVDTKDALLITKKGSSQKVKKIISKLVEEKSELPNMHLEVSRPWGKYTVLEDTKVYKIKRIEVNSGKRISLQKHFYRNEHWIVISGIATVTVDEKTFLLNPNESTYIKAGQIHRLENAEIEPLIIIEAQVGTYTGEDDIIRIDDDFKRK